MTVMTEPEIRERIKELVQDNKPLHKTDDEYHINYWQCPFCGDTGGEITMDDHVLHCDRNTTLARIYELRRVLGEAS